MTDEFEDESPWDAYQRSKEAGQDVPLDGIGELAISLYKQLLLGTFTGHAFGADPSLVVRLIKFMSAADMLLAKLLGCGAIRTQITFDPKFAIEQADDLEEKMGGSNVVIETLRQVAYTWLENPGLMRSPPINPHFVLAAMQYWSLDSEFTWKRYEELLPRIFSETAESLIKKLHLDPQERLAGINQLIDTIGKLPVEVAAPVFVRFENDTGERTPDFGPYVWVQTIHNELKVAPTGRHLASLVPFADGAGWVVRDGSTPPGIRYANMIIGPAKVPAGWVQPEDPPDDASHV